MVQFYLRLDYNSIHNIKIAYYHLNFTKCSFITVQQLGLIFISLIHCSTHLSIRLASSNSCSLVISKISLASPHSSYKLSYIDSILSSSLLFHDNIGSSQVPTYISSQTSLTVSLASSIASCSVSKLP